MSIRFSLIGMLMGFDHHTGLELRPRLLGLPRTRCWSWRLRPARPGMPPPARPGPCKNQRGPSAESMPSFSTSIPSHGIAWRGLVGPHLGLGGSSLRSFGLSHGRLGGVLGRLKATSSIPPGNKKVACLSTGYLPGCGSLG